MSPFFKNNGTAILNKCTFNFFLSSVKNQSLGKNWYTCTLSVYDCWPQLPPTAFLYQLTQPHPIIKLYCSVFYCLEFQWYLPPPERNNHHTTTFVPITQQTHHQRTPSGPATRLWLIPTQSPKQFGWRASVSQSCCVYSGQDGHGWASLSRSVKTPSHHILFFNAVWHGCLDTHTHTPRVLPT